METTAEYKVNVETPKDSASKVFLVIAGRKGCGKNTVANYLHNRYMFEQYAFADEIRYIVHSLYGLDFQKMCGLTPEDREWREQPLEILGGKSVRQVLKDIAEVGRQIHLDTWVNVVLKEVEHSDRVVVTDCRFLNEAQRCKQKGAKLIYLNRGERTDFHHSEDLTGLEEIADYTIDNNSTEEQLFKVAKEIVEHELSAVKV